MHYIHIRKMKNDAGFVSHMFQRNWKDSVVSWEKLNSFSHLKQFYALLFECSILF